MTERLLAIAKLIAPCNHIADIGTDHAYLPAYLIKQSSCNRAIASDINEGPLANAAKTLEKECLDDKIDLRLGGGFEPYVVGDADAYILAGMGGHLIVDIFKAKPEVPHAAQQLIIQPMQHPDVVRAYLCDNGYTIQREKFVREKDKFYQIIDAVYTGQQAEYDDFMLNYGIKPIQDAVYTEFLVKKHDRIANILKQISAATHADKHRVLTEELSKLKEKLHVD